MAEQLTADQGFELEKLRIQQAKEQREQDVRDNTLRFFLQEKLPGSMSEKEMEVLIQHAKKSAEFIIGK